MQKVQVKFKKLSENARVPSYGSMYSAGADLYVCSDSPITIEPHKTVMVHLGIAAEIPEGYVGLVFARSGIALKRGIAPANKVGVVDSDYRGELCVALHNHSDEPQTIDAFERVAQMVIMPYVFAEYVQVEELSQTDRGEGGFGSTGKK